jgi:ketosteroid isomerase-like protein
MSEETSEATRAFVKDLYEAYGRRDFDRVGALIDDDVEWIIFAPMHVFPFAGYRSGKRAVLDALAGIAKDYEIERYVPKVMIAQDEWAAVMSDAAFRQRSTGRVLSFQIANFLRFRAGRLVEFREFANTFDVVEQALGRALTV